MPHPVRLCSLAALAAGLSIQPALAQEADDTIIVTAQRENRTQVSAAGDLGALGPKNAQDVPFSVRSYNEALILNQQPLTLGAVLENDPTVRTTYGYGNASELFVIRGFPLYGDDVGLNGLYGIAPRQLIAPELFQSVQVLNGASAFLNGAAPGGSGLGGSVNLQLKRAGEAPLNRVTLGYTSDAQFGGSFDTSRRFGDDGAFGVRVNGAFRSGDVSVDDEFRRSLVVGAGLDWRGERARLSLDLGYQNVRVRGLRPKVTIGTATLPRVPEADANYAQPWTYSTLRDVFGIARFEYDLADNALFYATGGLRDGSEEGLYSGLTVTDAATGAATGNASYIPRTDNNESAQAGLRVKLGSVVTQEFNVGASINWQVNRNAYDFLYTSPAFTGFVTNLYNTPVAAVPDGYHFTGGDLDDPFPISRSRLWSTFASDTLGLWNDRVLLTAGLRLQAIRVKSYAYDGSGFYNTYDENAVTPVFGLVVKPVPGVSLYANRIEALQQGPSAPLDQTLVNAGEVFAPYKTRQYEIGGKVTLGRFDAALALFRTTLPSAYAVPLGDGSGLSRYAFDGRQRNQGVEFTLNGEVVDGLRLIGGVTLLDAKYRRTATGANEGNRVAGVAKWQGNANLEYDLPFATGLTLTGRVTYTGREYADAANTLEVPGWTRYDLGARYVVAIADNPVTLRVGVDNVTDKRYWASAYDTFSTSLLQGRPRTYRTSLSVDF